MKSDFLLRNEAQAQKFGKCLGSVLMPGDIVLLFGDLGAGKTTLAKYIAGALNIDARNVTSPSFAIIHEHPEGDLPLVHADLYRLGKGADLTETGLYEYINGKNVVLIEWADYLAEDFSNAFKIKLSFINEKARKLELAGDERVLAIKECMD